MPKKDNKRRPQPPVSEPTPAPDSAVAPAPEPAPSPEPAPAPAPAPVPVPGAFGRVFFEDFEDEKGERWSYEYSKAEIVPVGADGKGPHSGRYMAMGNWNGVAEWNDPANRSSLYLAPGAWTYDREFLMVLWYRYDANVAKAIGNKLFRLTGSFPDHSFFCGAQMENAMDPQMFISFEGVDRVMKGVVYGGGMAGDGAWHELKIYLRANTPGQTDGMMRVWNDNVLRMDIPNIQTMSINGTRWDALNFVSNWSNNPGWEHGALNNVYLDDVSIYSDHGTGGSGVMADGTAQP